MAKPKFNFISTQHVNHSSFASQFQSQFQHRSQHFFNFTQFHAPANAEMYWFLVLDDFKTLFRDIPLIELGSAMIRYMCDAIISEREWLRERKQTQNTNKQRVEDDYAVWFVKASIPSLGRTKRERRELWKRAGWIGGAVRELSDSRAERNFSLMARPVESHAKPIVTQFTNKIKFIPHRRSCASAMERRKEEKNAGTQK